ncbi:MAG: hypothetical protein GXX96_13790, partial [Planctomycetaceae bacterium]|nr:hypothetical protein [Planctomycetaceae bacterium]
MARAALAASNPRDAFFSHPFICPAIPQKNLFTPATIIQLYPLKTRNTHNLVGDDKRPTKQEKEQATETMKRIEKEKNLKGFLSK